MTKRKIRRVGDFVFIPLGYEQDIKNLNDEERELKNKYGGLHPISEELEDNSALLDEDINLDNTLLNDEEE